MQPMTWSTKLPNTEPPVPERRDEEPSWPIAVVNLLDRCLNNPAPFLRLCLLLFVITVILVRLKEAGYV